MSMTSWYKAVTDDYTSFHDPTFKYEIGKRIRPKPAPWESRQLCGPGVLHASPSAAEAVSFNARWPWRILTVTGKPFLHDDGPPAKAGFRQLVVVDEVPRHSAFGPQGELVERIVVRCESLTAQEADDLDATRAATWAATWAATRDATWAAAWAATRDATRAAAWAATRAAAVSDLVGQHGLTEGHIRTLYQPWQTIIGTPDITELFA